MFKLYLIRGVKWIVLLKKTLRSQKSMLPEIESTQWLMYVKLFKGNMIKCNTIISITFLRGGGGGSVIFFQIHCCIQI